MLATNNFTNYHKNATVYISQGDNGMYNANINWLDGDISSITASSLADVNIWLAGYWSDLGDILS